MTPDLFVGLMMALWFFGMGALYGRDILGMAWNVWEALMGLLDGLFQGRADRKRAKADLLTLPERFVRLVDMVVKQGIKLIDVQHSLRCLEDKAEHHRTRYGKKLSEFWHQLEAIRVDLHDLRNFVTSQTAYVQVLKRKGIEHRVDQLERKDAENGLDLSTHHQRLTKLEQEPRGVSASEVEGVKSNLNFRIDSLNNLAARQGERINGVNVEVHNHGAELSSVRDRLAFLEAKARLVDYEALRTRIVALEAKAAEQAKHATFLEACLTATQDELAERTEEAAGQ